MPLIFFLVVCWGLYNAAKEAPARVAARPKSGRSGLSDFLDEVWHGFWEHKAAALSAARNAKDLNGDGRASWKERWAAARGALKRGAVQVGRVIADSPLVRPVGESRPAVTPDPVPTAPPQPSAEPARTATAQSDPEPSATPAGDTTMTAPAGHAAEANRHEAALRKLNELGHRVDSQQDRAGAARNYLDRVDDIIDAVEQEQQRLAAETQQMTEALTAVHMDSSSLAEMASITEALDPNALAECVAHAEALKAAMQKVVAGADTARAAIATTRQQLMAKYGDANDVVQNQLSGDASYLQGEGGSVAVAPVQQPVGAGAPTA